MKMITPDDIRKKARAYWNNLKFLKAELMGEPFFPLLIPFRKVTAKEVMENFTAVREWITALHKGSLENSGFGYRIEYRPVNHRSLGNQMLPGKIVINTRDDFLRLIHKTTDYRRFMERVKKIETDRPELFSLIRQKPQLVLQYDSAWPGLLQVCRYFKQNPLPNRYLRELDIEGLDTKFIEQHKSILRELLDIVLPEDAVVETKSSGRYGFEKRFGLKHDLPLIRFRLLDSSLSKSFGMSDISIPVTEFNRLDISCRNIFITENKMNGLSFPELPRSMVIFGLGYGIQCLKSIFWLKAKKIYYWGDIDTHGFAILSMLRGYYRQTESFLMDRNTFFQFKHLWGEEQDSKRTIAELAFLMPEENDLYLELKENVHGKNLRLEQERISYTYVIDHLHKLRTDE